MGEKNTSFVLKDGLGAIATVEGFHEIPRKRRCVENAKCVVLVAKIQYGAFREGNKIILEGPNGKKLKDTAARIENNRRQITVATQGTSMGVLLMKNDKDKLTKLGLPLLRVRGAAGATPTMHP
jgi:hypothetical protein